MSSLVSIIVPVYNVEVFLPRCIQSLILQSYKNLEIILVDDGSTDNSLEICKQYCQNDTRIQVIHKDNGGLSSARNAGLDLAKGDYVLFVDSDDWIEKNTVESTLALAEKNKSDLVFFDIKNVYEDGRREILPNSFPYEFNISQFDFWRLYFSEHNLKCCVCCNKLYRRKVYGSLRFREGMIHEDEFILYDIISLSSTISYLNKPLYNYYHRNGSIMHDRKLKNYTDGITAYVERFQKFYKDGNSFFLPGCIDYALSCYTEGRSYFMNKNDIKFLNSSIKLLGKNINIYQCSISSKYKVKLIIAQILPALYYRLIRFKRSRIKKQNDK